MGTSDRIWATARRSVGRFRHGQRPRAWLRSRACTGSGLRKAGIVIVLMSVVVSRDWEMLNRGHLSLG